jgi:hypothetical protein
VSQFEKSDPHYSKAKWVCAKTLRGAYRSEQIERPREAIFVFGRDLSFTAQQCVSAKICKLNKIRAMRLPKHRVFVNLGKHDVSRCSLWPALYILGIGL